jgi:hypothetical protein
MNEELGLAVNDLKGQSIYHIAGYESFNEKPDEHFYNAEWRDIYTATISTEHLGRIRFKDGEAAGLFFCPLGETGSLLRQESIPITSSLSLLLQHCVIHP